MSQSARLLHITDTHILLGGGDYNPDDIKQDIGVAGQSRGEALQTLLKRIATDIHCNPLDGVVFSGDALARGVPGGNQLLLDLIVEQLRIAPERILAVPGNHDVPKGSAPGSPQRYQDFLSVWRAAGCITPWLDGVDSASAVDWEKHVLLGPENAWAVLAVNTCNWSHVEVIPEGLKTVWHKLALRVAEGDQQEEERVARELNELVRHDAAHISVQQFERLREILRVLPQPSKGRQLRMVALHHHLRNPTLRLEFKSMPDLIPLEQFRTLLLQRDIKVVFHGHKHEWRQHFDHVETFHDVGGRPHRVLLLAGGTFSDSAQSHAAGRVQIEGLPWAPTVRVETFASPRSGLDLEVKASAPLRLWEYTQGGKQVPSPMPVIQGDDFNEVYAKVRAAASEEATPGPLVVQLDFRGEAAWQLPEGYPTSVAEQRREGWLKGLVEWWQQRDSQLERRVPYIHGSRLLKYGNNLDQLKRVIGLLRERNTSRALAVLLDPRLDFVEHPKVEFASFCLVQFTRRDVGSSHVIDVIGYYRAQEMLQWWPINVAELRYLQEKVVEGAGGKPGRITTITASARVENAPSPTHVAMPVIDRWLDQAPEKFFRLAMYMLHGKSDAANDPLVEEWLDELAALQQSARRPARDGGPVVAIDGPARLALYLTAYEGVNAGKCQELATELHGLARHAQGRPSSDDALRSWEENMQTHLSKVIALSRQALGLPHS
ncbi:metallophosphoesterase [Ramlibacter sp.]|uniref:metallophosphoesterase n=1 Tax=Ramlibacter sp. TaxID=1917967 RepID=UPI002CA6E698|nr:metallophosphoesterase [Ramlibacter sp.]HWI81568.1 metallophosphoesterase [Ramlibacter sp.]